MKALTLHQPWATLITLGVKTVETRSWNTNYRGELAIHAGLRRPEMMWLPPFPTARSGSPELWHWSVIDTITDPKYHGPRSQGSRVPKRAKTPTLFYPRRGPHARVWDSRAGTSATEQGTALYLPLGAIIAVCELVDVCQMGDIAWSDEPGWWRHVERGGADHVETIFVNREQEYYGDFRPGRFAWLLDNIRPVDPVPARGAQGLWEWTS